MVEIVKFIKKHFNLFEKYKLEIKEILPHAKITLAGSLFTSKYGKDEIDILVEVDDLEKSFDKLSKIYSAGPIDSQVGYLKKIDGTTRLDIQLHDLNCGAVRQKKKIANIEKDNSYFNKKYEELKLNSKNSSSEKYKEDKSIFFSEVINYIKEIKNKNKNKNKN